MCFSATASFGSGILLSAIGVASVKKSSNSRQYMFAAIPFFFAAQQFCEGILWLTLPYATNDFTEKAATFTFLGVAQIFWPVWVPLAVLRTEKNIYTQNFLIIFVCVGILFAAFAAYFLASYEPHAHIVGKHIAYKIKYPVALDTLVGIVYVMVTTVPALTSKYRSMKYFSLAVLVSYGITKLFYTEHLISVWCFFAAIISGMVYIVITEITTGEKSARKKLRNLRQAL